MNIEQKLDALFTVRSDDNLYNAWRAFTPPERDVLFTTLFRLARQSGITRRDMEPVLRDALAGIEPEVFEDTSIDQMLHEIGKEVISKHEGMV